VWFYQEQDRVVRYSVMGPAGPADPLFTSVEELPPSPGTAVHLQDVQDQAGALLRMLEKFPGARGAIGDAAALLGDPTVVEEVFLALDVDTDSEITLDELLAADLLGVARDLVTALGLDPGGGSPVIGADDDLRGLLEFWQADLAMDVSAGEEPPFPPYDLAGGVPPGDPVAFLLGQVLPELPGLGTVAIVLLTASLAMTGLATRRAVFRP
jgi:hypothetical protein